LLDPLVLLVEAFLLLALFLREYFIVLACLLSALALELWHL
jgi:hypothetical protein